MGSIYAVQCTTTGMPAALKVVRRDLAGDPGIVHRFQRETELALRIRHPNVCTVIRRGHLEDGRPYLLMPLYEGNTLGEQVRRHGPLPLSEALSVADQVLAGLAALHAAGVVHRDLQPDNVVLIPSSEEPLVKLIDLGFAHAPGVDTGDGLTPESRGALVGTLRFMSPEQATRGRAITTRSDLFVAALLLYYTVSGELPFPGQTYLDVLVALVRDAPIPLRRLCRDVPRALDDVLSRALAKHPDARFADADDMRAALREIAASVRARLAPAASHRAYRPPARSLR